MKVIMILTNGFDPDVRVYKEAKYLVSKGFEVTILCWDRKCEYSSKIEEVVDGIQIKRFEIPSKPGTGFKQIVPYLKFMKQVRKYLKDEKYEYLHCHDFDGILVGMLVKERKKKKLIFDMHEVYTHYAYAKNVFFKSCFKFVLRRVNYIIYVNDEQIKNITEKEKLVFLPNYPEIKTYLPIEKKKQDKMTINYIGSLRDYTALKALADLAIQREDLKIGLYGIGVCYDKLREEYKDTRVKVFGKYNGIEQSGEIYRNTDILYCSYNPEVENWKNAYPVKLFEAIVTLTPIVVSKDTKVGEFVREKGIGELIEYGKGQSIEMAISKIMIHYDEYVKNLKKITDDYCLERVILNLDKIYKEKG